MNHHSVTQIANDANVAKTTACAYRIKINQAIETMDGYKELFKGNTEADEYTVWLHSI